MRNLKIKLSVCVFASLMLATSCSDTFLEEKKDYNNLTTIDVYSDPSQAKAVYAYIHKLALETYRMPLHGADPIMRHAQSAGGNQWVFTEELAESGFYDSRYTGANTKQSKAGNHIANPPYWNDPRNNTKNYNNPGRKTVYPVVALINNFIQEIDASRYLYNNNTFWDNLKGQAIFLRAWIYFDAVRMYGGFPYYTTESDLPADDDQSPRMPIQDCIDKVCADFQLAADLLPAKWQNAEDYGRFTSVAALGMISRARLFMASPLFNASWDNTGSKRWQQALDASVAALEAADAAGYGTSVTDINSWDKAFYAYNNTFNPEAIIPILMSNDPISSGVFNKWEAYIRPGVVAQSTGGGKVAPQEILMAFPMKDGKPATVANGYDDDKFYRNRDPRFYRTFCFSGCQWPNPEKTRVWLYAWKFADAASNRYRYSDGSQGDGGFVKKGRAIVWKMSDPTVAAGSESTASTDIMEYRYGELLLNVAECYAAKGDAGNCLKYLGKIRQRVGIPSANNYGLGAISDRYALIRAVLNERLVELAYEGKRPWDMRRWLLFEGGAGFDPRIGGGFNDATYAYDPDGAWGTGWKIYDGKDGRPNYTKADNVLTRLGLDRWCGKKHTSKVMGYDIENIHAIEPGTSYDHPLKDNAVLNAVPAITREMSEGDRNAAFDKLEAAFNQLGIKTYDPLQVEEMGMKYALDCGTKTTDQNFLFAWRGWYYIYPIHYDMYDSQKGNSWLEQTAGWMIRNGNPAGDNVEEQDGTYYYCFPE